jgi:hypothetical protein
MKWGRIEAVVEVKTEAFLAGETEREMEAEVVMGPCWDHGAWLSRVTPWIQKMKGLTWLKT